MSSRRSSFAFNLLTLMTIGASFFVIFHEISPTNSIVSSAPNAVQIATVAGLPTASSTQTGTTTNNQAVHILGISTTTKNLPPRVTTKPMSTPTTTAQTPTVFEITRIQHPYSTPPGSFDDVNLSTRGALVNILCMPHGGSLKPISGSGVIIDPRGVILTNAHVGQFVLLSETPRVDLSCLIRTGSPAVARWTAEVLYIPPVWVSAHVSDINSTHPTGTGEHDYALLIITGSVDGTPLPTAFPALSFDTREAIGFLGDPVLGAADPAEFVGGLNAQNNLNAVSSVSNIARLFTFGTSAVDAFSIGGVIEAQGGSSGGPVVNAWNKLIGLITTTSDGATTAERSLRAVTMSYINRDIRAQTGSDLPTFLYGDLTAREDDFNKTWAQHLISLYIRQISK